MQHTPLEAEHIALHAKMVDFAGWNMPLHYGSQLAEHQIVRESVGVFDVSHMTQIEVKGLQAQDFLRYLLANDVSKLKTYGSALYTCMLNEKGGIIDDLIVYYINPEFYLLVTNAGTHDQDITWIQQQAAQFNVHIHERTDLAMLAIQGPLAQEILAQVLPQNLTTPLAELRPFHFFTSDPSHITFLVARTGYTGENGYEILLPAEQAPKFWRDLLKAGVKPIGLGARDTLRLEAALNLYGTDMDQTTTPLETNLAWTIAWEPSDRNFIGKQALLQQKEQGVNKQLVCIILNGKGVLRGHQTVLVPEGKGHITSGSFSPVLQKGIGFAQIPLTQAKTCEVEMRNGLQTAQIVKGPFVRMGKIVYNTPFR